MSWWNDEQDVTAHIEDDIAIGAFEMRKFIHINGRYINTDHIVGVFHHSAIHRSDGSIEDPKMLTVQTSIPDLGVQVSTESEDGQALLSWLADNTDMLTPYISPVEK